jgi:3-hydroxybutyryl-CoA dehydrogenase
MKPKTLRQAVVIGTGQMGPGIAYTLASAGLNVTLCGRSPESMEKGMAAVRRGAGLLAAEGIITEEFRESVFSRISGTYQPEPVLPRADLVIESIVEDLSIKQALFSRIEPLCPVDALLTSNTSGLPATRLAASLKNPGRFAVTHFWNPPHLMPLVEVVKGENTSPDTVDVLLTLLKTAGKKPVAVLKDTPGQLGNRLFHALIREGIHIVEEGIATAEDVDAAASYGFGRRLPAYGVLTHQDAVGLDMVYAIQSYLCRSLCNATEPAAVLKEKVERSELGVKSARGFFDWKKRDIREIVEKRDRFLVDLLKSEKDEQTGK